MADKSDPPSQFAGYGPVVTVALTPERGEVTVAGTTAVASEGEGSGEEGCTGGHSSWELPRH